MLCVGLVGGVGFVLGALSEGASKKDCYSFKYLPVRGAVFFPLYISFCPPVELLCFILLGDS